MSDSPVSNITCEEQQKQLDQQQREYIGWLLECICQHNVEGVRRLLDEYGFLDFINPNGLRPAHYAAYCQVSKVIMRFHCFVTPEVTSIVILLFILPKYHLLVDSRYSRSAHSCWGERESVLSHGDLSVAVCCDVLPYQSRGVLSYGVLFAGSSAGVSRNF